MIIKHYHIPDEFGHFIGDNIRLDPVMLDEDKSIEELLSFYMGKNTPDRQQFIIENLKVEFNLDSMERIEISSLHMQANEIENMIREQFPNASITITDLAGDGNHYSATVTSSQFSGKSKIEQHKMVYNSLKGKMGNELHALAIKTKEK